MFHVVFLSGEVLLGVVSFFLPPEPLSRKARNSPVCSELQRAPREGSEEERRRVLGLMLHAGTRQGHNDRGVPVLHRLLQ